MQLENLDPQVVGQRLADARKARGVTQKDAADYLECSRPTLIAIEKGSRPAKAQEIVKLASFYGRSVHELVRPGEPMADLQPHLRAVAQRMDAEDTELLQGIANLQRFAEDYRQLEQIMNAPLKLNYPQDVNLSPRFDVVALAEDVAVRERHRLNLGDQPIIDLRNVLENEAGLRILYENLPSPIAGMFAFVTDFGCCIAVNRKHPPERRRASMVHEYGHLVTDRFKPGIDYLNYAGRKPANERFAESFGMAFLMPATSLRRRFNEAVSTTDDFKIADLCRLSHLFYVSVEAMTLRLEGLGMIPRGTREYLKESRFEVRRAAEMLQLPKLPISDDRFPDRYKFLAIQAYEMGELSEGQLTRFLRCDPVTAREIVAEYVTTTDVSDDGEILSSQLDLQLSLLSDGS